LPIRPLRVYDGRKQVLKKEGVRLLKIFSGIIRALKNHLSPDRASDIDDLIKKTERENDHATICVTLKQQRSSSGDPMSGILPSSIYFYRNYISVRSVPGGNGRDIVFEEYIDDGEVFDGEMRRPSAVTDDPMEITRSVADKIKSGLPKATVESYDRRSLLSSMLDQDIPDEKHI
jgi:hypothetical protein